jgi:hypothetical protein
VTPSPCSTNFLAPRRKTGTASSAQPLRLRPQRQRGAPRPHTSRLIPRIRWVIVRRHPGAPYPNVLGVARRRAEITSDTLDHIRALSHGLKLRERRGPSGCSHLSVCPGHKHPSAARQGCIPAFSAQAQGSRRSGVRARSVICDSVARSTCTAGVQPRERWSVSDRKHRSKGGTVWLPPQFSTSTGTPTSPSSHGLKLEEHHPDIPTMRCRQPVGVRHTCEYLSQHTP